MKDPMNISKEHLSYLRGIRKKSITINVIRICILVFFIAFWEISATLEWVNPFITSSPSRIIKCIADLYQNGALFYHIGTTLWETLVGFFLSVALGYIIALPTDYHLVRHRKQSHHIYDHFNRVDYCYFKYVRRIYGNG